MSHNSLSWWAFLCAEGIEVMTLKKMSNLGFTWYDSMFRGELNRREIPFSNMYLTYAIENSLQSQKRAGKSQVSDAVSDTFI